MVPVILVIQEAAEAECKPSMGKVSKTLSQKQKTNKRAGHEAKVVEHLPNMRRPCNQSQLVQKEKIKESLSSFTDYMVFL
jgi:hypothetical protein